MSERQVDVVVTNKVVGSYEARSYPNDQTDASGFYPLYSVPVYRIQVKGTNATHQPVVADFAAPRFMPFYNDPKNPKKEFRALGWVNAGLSAHRRVAVSTFNPDYEVHNRLTPEHGAIVVYETFYIHAGPASLQDVGAGSAGCIEIVGDFHQFKQTIADLSGLPATWGPDHAILRLVHRRKLVVTIQAARAPDIHGCFTRRIRW